jgi:Uma2 family endonuclease
MEIVLEKTQSVTLQDVSWDSYTEMADRIQEESAAHINFDRGTFEIITLSLEHENLKRILAMILDHLMSELDVEFFVAGSTTFRREDLQRGAEPDDCYYIRHAERMRGKKSVIRSATRSRY